MSAAYCQRGPRPFDPPLAASGPSCAWTLTQTHLPSLYLRTNLHAAQQGAMWLKVLRVSTRLMILELRFSLECSVAMPRALRPGI